MICNVTPKLIERIVNFRLIIFIEVGAGLIVLCDIENIKILAKTIFYFLDINRSNQSLSHFPVFFLHICWPVEIENSHNFNGKPVQLYFM